VHRPRREKIGLFFIFGACAFATAASVVRLHTIYRYTRGGGPVPQQPARQPLVGDGGQHRHLLRQRARPQAGLQPHAAAAHEGAVDGAAERRPS
jgi:hypothetical protein